MDAQSCYPLDCYSPSTLIQPQHSPDSEEYHIPYLDLHDSIYQMPYTQAIQAPQLQATPMQHFYAGKENVPPQNYAPLDTYVPKYGYSQQPEFPASYQCFQPAVYQQCAQGEPDQSQFVQSQPSFVQPAISQPLLRSLDDAHADAVAQYSQFVAIAGTLEPALRYVSQDFPPAEHSTYPEVASCPAPQGHLQDQTQYAHVTSRPQYLQNQETSFLDSGLESTSYYPDGYKHSFDPFDGPAYHEMTPYEAPPLHSQVQQQVQVMSRVQQAKDEETLQDSCFESNTYQPEEYNGCVEYDEFQHQNQDQAYQVPSVEAQSAQQAPSNSQADQLCFVTRYTTDECLNFQCPLRHLICEDRDRHLQDWCHVVHLDNLRHDRTKKQKVLKWLIHDDNEADKQIREYQIIDEPGY